MRVEYGRIPDGGFRREESEMRREFPGVRARPVLDHCHACLALRGVSSATAQHYGVGVLTAQRSGSSEERVLFPLTDAEGGDSRLCFLRRVSGRTGWFPVSAAASPEQSPFRPLAID